MGSKLKKKDDAKPTKARPVQRTKKDIEREKREIESRKDENANKLFFRVGKTKKGKKTYYWVLLDKNGVGIARSFESKSRRIDAIRDAISALGRSIWVNEHHIIDDGDHNRLYDEAVRQGIISEGRS